MNIEQSGITGFEKFCSEWRHAYQWVIYSFAAIKTENGPQLFFARISFDVQKGIHSDEHFIFETESLIVGHVVIPLSDPEFDKIILGIKKAEIVIYDKTFSLFIDDQTINVSTFFSPLYHPMHFKGPRLPSFVQRGGQKYRLIGSGADIKKYDWELKACDKPFESFNELLTYCGLPGFEQLGDSATIEIIMNLPAFITKESNLNGNNINIELFLSSRLDKNKIKIGYRVFQNGIVNRNSIKGADFQWQENAGNLKGIYSFATKNVQVVQAFLSYDETAWHEWWIVDIAKQLNPRAAIHQAFDEKFDIIKDMLFRPEGGEKSRYFEGAVLNLYTILGFTAVHYGRNPKLQDGPDIIAGTPVGNICVIECTIGHPTLNDKMAKVIQRTSKIREKLKPNYPQYKIQPTIVTLLSREEAKVHLETAGKYNIAIICKEDLENHLQHIIFPQNPENLFEDIVKLIPSIQGSM